MPKVQKRVRDTAGTLATTAVFGSKKPKYLCQEPECGTRATFGSANGKAAWCSDHRLPDHVDLLNKKCKAPGCLTRPSFGPMGGKKSDAIFCGDHRLPDHVDLLHKKCQAFGCLTQPSFGPVGGKRSDAIFCSDHRLPGHVDLLNKKCEALGCLKQPSFGPMGGKKSDAIFCGDHRSPGHVDLLNKKCKAPGCLKHPSFGPVGGKGSDAIFCGDHRLPGHVDLLNKKCEAPGCLKHPSFGPVGGKKSDAIFCGDHRLPDHVDLINKKCKAFGCLKRPSFGPVGGKGSDAIFCGDHRLPDHVDLLSKKCKASGCLKRPTYGPVGGKGSDAIFCGDHRLPDHVNLVHKRCLQDGCIIRALYALPGHKPSHCAAHADKTTMIAWPRKRCCIAECKSTGLYEHLDQRYCEAHAPLELARCLVKTTCKTCLMENVVITNGTCDTCAPDRVRRIRHLKEEQVAFALQRGGVRIAGRDVILEGTACGLERPDFQIASVPVEGAHWVYVECDEWQHATEPEECRVTRMRNLAEVRGVPVVFIRFNPDSYLPGENPDGGVELRPVPLAKRYDVLVRWVKHVAEHGPPAGHVVSVLYLFFDGFTNRVTPASWQCLVARECM